MDQRRLMIAIALSIAVVLVYNELVVRPRQRAGSAESPLPEGPVTGSVPPTTSPVAAQPGATPAAAAPVVGGGYLSFDPGSAPPIVVETDLFRATVTPVGGRFSSFALKNYRRSVEPDSPPLDLVEHADLLPLTLDLGPGESDAAVVYTPGTQTVSVEGGATATLVLTGATSTGARIEKRIRFAGDSYLMDVDVSFAGGGDSRTIGLVVPRLSHEGLGSGTGSATRELGLAFSEGKLVEKDYTGVGPGGKEPPKGESHGSSLWVGFGVPYFLSAAVVPSGNATATIEEAGSTPIGRIDEPSANGAATFRVFMGPKTRELLTAAGFELNRSLDFGWFWFIALPMLWALRQLHHVTGNYGIDIILLTGIVRVGTIPLTRKSFRSMREMQKLQPQLKRLQELYKDDQTKLQQEMMALYKSHNVNPFSGCAPMILQIPIFVGLYNALSHAIELRHAPFCLWITDLSSPERLTIAGTGIPLMTIFMGGTMILQQWLTPQQGDPTQRQMMMIMPLIFTYMFINFPAGLVLYWLVSNLLGIAQQYSMLRSTPRS
jgi:YidC/Oxa1 family membrane protein insertase